MKMMEFSVAYGCLAIGFMMAFMILFSSDEPFNKFPGTLVSVSLLIFQGLFPINEHSSRCLS